jgi:hypothetical protein
LGILLRGNHLDANALVGKAGWQIDPSAGATAFHVALEGLGLGLGFFRPSSANDDGDGSGASDDANMR